MSILVNKPLTTPLSELECQILKCLGFAACPSRDLDEWMCGLVQLMADAQLGFFLRLIEGFPQEGEVVASFLSGNLLERYEMYHGKPSPESTLPTWIPRRRKEDKEVSSNS
jgi:hypothetical protein